MADDLSPTMQAALASVEAPVTAAELLEQQAQNIRDLNDLVTRLRTVNEDAIAIAKLENERRIRTEAEINRLRDELASALIANRETV